MTMSERNPVAPCYQKTPAGILSAMVAAASDDSISAEHLREMIRGIGDALACYERDGLSLRDIILTAHENEASPDHALAQRVVTATIACKPFDDAAVRAGALQRHLQLHAELVDYAEVIRAGDLDGSEPEFGELISAAKSSQDALFGRVPEGDQA